MSKMTFDNIPVGAIFLTVKREDGTFSPVCILNNKEVEDVLASVIETLDRGGILTYNKNVVLKKVDNAGNEIKDIDEWMDIDTYFLGEI